MTCISFHSRHTIFLSNRQLHLTWYIINPQTNGRRRRRQQKGPKYSMMDTWIQWIIGLWPIFYSLDLQAKNSDFRKSKYLFRNALIVPIFTCSKFCLVFLFPLVERDSVQSLPGLLLYRFITWVVPINQGTQSKWDNITKLQSQKYLATWLHHWGQNLLRVKLPGLPRKVGSANQGSCGICKPLGKSFWVFLRNEKVGYAFI